MKFYLFLRKSHVSETIIGCRFPPFGHSWNGHNGFMQGLCGRIYCSFYFVFDFFHLFMYLEIQKLLILSSFIQKHVLYARHYKPRFVFFFTQFSLWLRLILQTIYVLKMKILHFSSSKSTAYNRERLMMARVRYEVASHRTQIKVLRFPFYKPMICYIIRSMYL